jgi:hypothetical protein
VAVTRVYSDRDIDYDGPILRFGGQSWLVDAVDVHEGEPGCEDDAVAYLSPLPESVG